MHPQSSQFPKALVSGASISGLTVAYWLARYGFEVTVVERATHLRPGGHALDVRGPALDVAARMGILQALRDRSTKLTGIAVVDADGNELFRSTDSTLTGGRLDSPDVEILRDDLCQVLFEAVGARAEYLFGDFITAMVQDDSGVDVTFAGSAPRRFEVVVGADGVGSGLRRIAFGPDEQFVHRLGDLHVATFGMPNFLGLERWQVMYQAPDSLGALVMGLRKDAPARTYLGFNASDGRNYDLRDVDAQKRLLAECAVGAGWVVPEIVEHMLHASDFHFYSLRQVRMSSWSRGRIVLTGDAGYAVSLGTGQATSVAMVGAYVLASELARHCDVQGERPRGDGPDVSSRNGGGPHASGVLPGIAAYEHALRAYVIRNQEIAIEVNNAPTEPSADDGASGGLPDFGALTLPFQLGSYADLVRRA